MINKDDIIEVNLDLEGREIRIRLRGGRQKSWPIQGDEALSKLHQMFWDHVKEEGLEPPDSEGA